MTPAESECSKIHQPRLILMWLSGKHCFLAWKGSWPNHSHNRQTWLRLFVSCGSALSNGSQDRKKTLFTKSQPSFTQQGSLLPAYTGAVPSRAGQNTCERSIPATQSRCQ